MLSTLIENLRNRLFKRNFKVCQTPRGPEPVFHLFFHLPAEIRERIYELCCDNDRRILEDHFVSAKPPPEPAIACASRTLRTEALPVFYKHYRFPLTFGSGALINKGHISPSQEWRAARWYHRIDAVKLKMIKRIELYYCFGKFEVDFDARKGGYEVVMTAWGAQRLVDVSVSEERKQVLALVREVLDDMLRKAVVGNLTARDFDRLELEVSVEGRCDS